MSWSSINDSLEGLHLPEVEDLHPRSTSYSTQAEDSFHLDLMAANMMPSPTPLMADADDNYLSLGMADPNDVLREEAYGPYQSLQDEESNSYQRVEGFLDADEVELYLGANCPSAHVTRRSSNSEERQPWPDLHSRLHEGSQLLSLHQAGVPPPPTATQRHGAVPKEWAHRSHDFLEDARQPDLLLESPAYVEGGRPGPAIAGHDGPEVSRSNAPRKKGARHRHQRQFLPEEERQQRGRQLNNEASQIYRQKRKERNSEEVQQLERLEKHNHDLKNYYSALKKYREVLTKYQGYLPTVPDPTL